MAVSTPLRSLSPQAHSAVPSIDFGPFLHGSTSARQRVAFAVDQALSSMGFLRLHNHGIEQRKIDACFRNHGQSKRLFASEVKKDAVSHLPQPQNRGYVGIGNERIRGRTCMKESFDLGNSEDDNSPNVWPVENNFPGFRHSVEDFFQDCAKLTYELLDCLSLALSLSKESSLGEHHFKTLFNLSLIHYPILPAERFLSGELVRCPPHSDFGTLTLLFQDDVGGLEIADPASTKSAASATVERCGTFLPVDPEPGTIIVNVGYLLMKWTNGRWRNTVHKVSAPPHWSDTGLQSSNTDGKGSYDTVDIPERYSIAYFSAPDPATVVEALPCCRGDDATWKPINAGEYLRRKRAASYA